MLSKKYIVLLLLVCASFNTACVSSIILGGGAATTAAFDERPVGQHFDDVSIATEIDARLIAEKDMPSRWVSIEVIEGVVILTGYLPSQAHIDRAVFLCRSVEGVKDIDNQLYIGEPSTSSLFSDSWITAQVKTKFLNDTLVGGMSVHVETVAGKVYLQGVLASEAQRYRAMELTKSVDGVTAVVDLLRLRSK
ncbi:MAG: BON domain-containing protein [Mariprofundaceae bacterium]|nr:BON domain-containing protein [Mariprofundaceae bacterium]